MRIRLILGDDPDRNKIPENTYLMLRKQLEQDNDIVLTDENPDVIHFIGAWNSQAVNIAKDATSKFIAYIHTPLGSLAPWHKPSSASSKQTNASLAIVSSGQMEHELLDDGSHPTLTCILSAVTTRRSSAEEMAKQYKAVYADVIKKNDENLWDDAEKKVKLINEQDETILCICKYLFYANSLSIRHNIPQQFLNELAAIMIQSDYDEDRIDELLKLIKLHLFTQRIEFIMQETTSLTEGFMPVPWKKDKVAESMLKMITNYEHA